MPRKLKNKPPNELAPVTQVYKAAKDQPLATDTSPEDRLPEPPPERLRAKSWGETVRPWSSHGDTGVHHVTTKSPDMTGIKFDSDQKRTDAEKAEMEEHGLKYFTEAKSWLKNARNGAYDETQELAAKIAEQRRVAREEEHGR